MTQPATPPGPRPISKVAELLPPNSEASERAVLSSTITDSTRIGKTFEIAQPSTYYDRARQRIATAVASIMAKGETPDEQSVRRWLQDHAPGGVVSQSEAAEFAEILLGPYTLAAEQHARIVRDHYIRRQRISVEQWRIAELREAKRPIEDVDREADERLAVLVGPPEAKEPRIRFLNAPAIFAQLPPIPWVIRGLDMCPGAPSLFAGYGYSGKSIVLQSMLLQIAAGVPVWRTFTASQGGCIHFDYEQGEHLTRLRYQRLAWALDLTPHDLEDRLQLVCFPPFYLDEPEAEGILLEACQGKILAVFDSFRAACRSTEENSSEARVPLDMLGRVSERTGCAMAIIHHARKVTVDAPGGIRDSIRGSSALYDACGSVFVLEGKPEDPDRTIYHCKARVSGKVQDPMTLRIEDAGEPGPDGSAAGLSVTASRAPTADERQKSFVRMRDEKTKEELREVFRRQSHQTSIEAMAASIGRAVATARHGLRLLIADGEVVETGTTKTKGYDYVGK